MSVFIFKILNSSLIKVFLLNNVLFDWHFLLYSMSAFAWKVFISIRMAFVLLEQTFAKQSLPLINVICLIKGLCSVKAFMSAHCFLLLLKSLHFQNTDFFFNQSLLLNTFFDRNLLFQCRLLTQSLPFNPTHAFHRSLLCNPSLLFQF